jgi:hypothetical protein
MRLGISGLAVIAALAAVPASDAVAARGDVPSIDIRNTCRIAAGAMVRLMGSTSMNLPRNGAQHPRDKHRSDQSAGAHHPPARSSRPPLVNGWLHMERN